MSVKPGDKLIFNKSFSGVNIFNPQSNRWVSAHPEKTFQPKLLTYNRTSYKTQNLRHIDRFRDRLKGTAENTCWVMVTSSKDKRWYRWVRNFNQNHPRAWPMHLLWFYRLPILTLICSWTVGIITSQKWVFIVITWVILNHSADPSVISLLRLKTGLEHFQVLPCF